MEFSRQEYWTGLPVPTPGHLPNPGIKQLLLTVENDVSKLGSEHFGLCQVPFKGENLSGVHKWFWLPVFWYTSRAEFPERKMKKKMKRSIQEHWNIPEAGLGRGRG